jgi:cytochrome c biogenesis protein CcmG/thiol:disulfide interchange protein DsbE
VLIVVTVGLLAMTSSSGGPGNTTNEAFDLPQLKGSGRVRLADFKGQPTVVNFFASWCSACDFELPGYAKVSGELKGRVHFVGVDALETGDPMYMPERHHITWWPLARDVGGSNGSGLHDALGGGNAMPITAFYDANGKLIEVERGALPESSLRAKLHKLYGT